MAELSTNLYFKHPDADIHNMLQTLFKSGNESDIIRIAKSLNTGKGESLAKYLIDYVDRFHDIVPEWCDTKSGYCICTFTHGSEGDEWIEAIIEFLGKLCSGIDVRACLAGDDEPYEIFYRLINRTVKRQDYSPEFEEAKKDDLPGVYKWWHDGLPDNIKEGWLNDWQDEDGNEDEDEEIEGDATCPFCGEPISEEMKTCDRDECIDMGIKTKL